MRWPSPSAGRSGQPWRSRRSGRRGRSGAKARAEEHDTEYIWAARFGSIERHCPEECGPRSTIFTYGLLIWVAIINRDPKIFIKFLNRIAICNRDLNIFIKPPKTYPQFCRNHPGRRMGTVTTGERNWTPAGRRRGGHQSSATSRKRPRPRPMATRTKRRGAWTPAGRRRGGHQSSAT
jgi:hypothetical protein